MMDVKAKYYFWLVILFLFIGLGNQGFAVDDATSLGYWPMDSVSVLSDGKVILRDEATVPTVHSRHNHHLVAFDGDQENGWGAELVPSMEGLDKALKLDGVNDRLASFMPFPVTESFEFELRAKIEPKPGENVWLADMPGVWWLTLESNATRLHLYVWDSEGESHRLKVSIDPAKGWHHIKAGFVDGKASVEVVGGDSASLDIGKGLNMEHPRRPFTVGARSNHNQTFKGLLDEIHLRWPGAVQPDYESARAGAKDAVDERGRLALQRYYYTYQDIDKQEDLRIRVNWAFAALSIHDDPQVLEKARAVLLDIMRENANCFTELGTEGHPMYWETVILSRMVNDPDMLEKISDELEQAIKAVLWDYVSLMQREGIANHDPQELHLIYKSDNHDIIHRGVFLMTAQALKNDPAWKDKTYADGKKPADQFARYRDNLMEYFRFRAATGVNVEFGATCYAGVHLQPIFNIADFCEDERLRAQAGRFLDLFFADVAQEVLNGVRGGAKVRMYKTHFSFDHKGDKTFYYNHLLAGTPEEVESLFPTDSFCALQSDYRLPDVVLDLMTSREELGQFAYVSRRLGQGDYYLEDFGKGVENIAPIYRADIPSDLLRYTWSSPSYVLGSFTVNEARTYMLISSQNHWMGLITDATLDSRIVVLVTSTASNDGRTGYRELQAVQNENCALFRKQVAAHDLALLRLYVSNDFELTEKDGRLFFENEAAYVQIIPHQPRNNTHFTIEPTSHGPGRFLTFEMPDVYLAMEVAEKGEYPDLEAFQRAMAPNRLEMEVTGLAMDYHSETAGTRLTLRADIRPPLVDGEPVELKPERVFDSPYLKSIYGSAVIDVRDSQGRQLQLDLNHKMSPGMRVD